MKRALWLSLLLTGVAGAQPVAEADAWVAAETRRIEARLNAVPAAIERASGLAEAGKFEAAVREIEDALAELPLNPLTREAVERLEAERSGIEARRAAGVESQVEVAGWVAKGRAQYLAGERDAARETFSKVEARDPGNREARNFLARLGEVKADEGHRRERTREELLEEVARSWERPQVFVEAGRGEAASIEAAPLEEKLNRIVLPNVSFTRVEIGQVVAALSAISEEFDEAGAMPRGVNIVLLDPSNKAPTVTITLRNASLRRVLDFVTEAVGYQYEVQADAVVVRPGGETSALETEFFPVARATVLRMTGAGGSATTARADPFSSAGASNEPGVQASAEGGAIRAFLQQAGVNFDAAPGSSLAYDGSALIVTHTARNIDRIRNILNRYNDVRQVEIEAKFMEVQEGALEELGVNWNLSTKATQRNAGAQAVYATNARALASAFSNTASNQQGRIVRPAAFNDANSNGVQDEGEAATQQEINIPIVNNAPRIPGAPDLALSAGPLATITGVIGEFDVNAVVRALSQQQGTDLLSAPKVTVLSGNPATITVAQEMRYPQSFGQTQSQVGTGSASGGGSAGVAITAGTPQEFTARNVGVELRVTPTVEEDDFSISLDLNPRVTEFDGFVEYGGPSIAISGSTTVTVPSGFYQPIFSVRDISTKVTIWDGATLVMGGLTREEVKKVNDKVPILGDLPLLGRAFRSKGESAQKRNLLIFVTANLVSPGGSPKKQHLRNVSANSIYRSASVVTPGGAEKRE